MDNAADVLQTFARVVSISNDAKIGFEDKLQKILEEIMQCSGMAKGSIMLMKGRKSLQVAASSRPELIGVSQSLDDENSPSAWVAENKKPLYVDCALDCQFPQKFDHYKKNAYFSVPLMAGKKVMGVLNLTDKVVLDLLSPKEQEFVLNIAGHFIMAIENQRLTQSLKKSKEKLRKKNLELRKVEKAKDQLFNMLVHDLKGPISEMVANLDLLTYTVKGENLEFIQSSRTACDSLYRMVSDMLEITKMEEGRLKLYLTPVNPIEIIDDALSSLSGMAMIKEIRFAKEIPHDGENCLFNADKILLSRVLQNLLVNAISYTDAGGGIILGYSTPKPNQIVFFVEDSGPGIPDGFEEKIFDKFVRVNEADQNRAYSTGLGLAFCQMAVIAHNGTIRAENATPAGARFSFTLPMDNGGGTKKSHGATEFRL
ncbi:GAF domain-containing sensor histidine kinase [Desulfatibacillum aliphaticivorans]|uniref:GAF domain-containing sensor histidine kinase n=1 Tax=Desulfatibacillum aliphaticivorans TaxID=218208 RepID=UPI000402DB87|nr:ATP-binding protein [Desulfatibacillum aliphaticivorans]